MKDVYANDPEKQAELDALREQADALGINYHHRAGIPRLKQALKEAQAVSAPGAAETVMNDTQAANVQHGLELPEGTRMFTEEEFKRIFPDDPARECNRLIRCRVQCMNPVKREWDGEIISVSNKAGTWKKFIPFNNEPYHIPKILFDFMKERECVTFVSKRVGPGKGDMTKEPRLIKEFAIEELPPLTPKELKDLAQRQAMASGTADAA